MGGVWVGARGGTGKRVIQKVCFRGEEMVWWLRAHATLAEDLSSIPSTHTEWFSSRGSNTLLWSSQVPAFMHITTYTDVHIIF